MLKSAYQQFEQRVGETKTHRGGKSELVIHAIDHAAGDFSVAEMQDKCPGVGLDLIRTTLKKFRAQQQVECLGRGRDARWRKTAKWTGRIG